MAIPNFLPHANAKTALEVNAANSSSFFAAFRFLSEEQKQDIHLVYAFCRMADDVVDDLKSVPDKKIGLQFLRQEITKIQNAQSPEHPVLKDLAKVIFKRQISLSLFFDLLDGCENDIEPKAYQTWAELEKYCYQVAGAVGLMCMPIFGYKNDNAKVLAVQLGLACQITNILRDVAEDLALGRIYIPKDLLLQYGASSSDLQNRNMTSSLKAVFQNLSETAKKSYQFFWKGALEDSQGSLRSAKAMATVYETLLDKIVRQNFPVFEGKVRLNYFEKAKVLWSFLVDAA